MDSASALMDKRDEWGEDLGRLPVTASGSMAIGQSVSSAIAALRYD